jgi:hypothetical protein
MKSTLILLRVLLFAPLAVVHAGRNMSGVPRLGIFRTDPFQALEIFGATASNDWN